MIKKKGNLVYSNIKMKTSKLIFDVDIRVIIKMIKKMGQAFLDILMEIGNKIYKFSYNGEYKNDLKEGKGVFEYLKDNLQIRYTGQFKNDKKEGKGIYVCY